MPGPPLWPRLLRASRQLLDTPWPWVILFALALLSDILATGGIPHNGDLAYPASLRRYADHFYPLWNEHTSVSNLENVDRLLVVMPLIWMAGPLGGIEVLAKILFMVPLVASGFAAAGLARWVLREVWPDRVPSRVAVLAAAFLYMVNPWVLEQLQAPFFWLAYAVTPGIILFTLRGLQRRSPWDGLAAAALWSLASGSPHFTIFSGLVIGSLVGLHALHGSGHWWTRIATGMRFLGATIPPYLGLNAFWIFPSFVAALQGPVSPGYSFTPDQLREFSQNSSLVNVLAGTDQAIVWYQPSPAAAALELVMHATMPLVFALALWVALVRRGRPSPSFYALTLTYLVAAWFSLGFNNLLYRWLAADAPLSSGYGWLLRVPGKISYLLWPTYAGSAAVVVQWALTRVGATAPSTGIPLAWPRPGGPAVRRALAMATVALLLFPAAGYSTAKAMDYFGYYYRPLEVPAPYTEAFQYLQAQGGDVRVADLAPYDQGLRKNSLMFESSYTWNPNRIAGYFVPRSLPGPGTGFYHFTFSENWRPAYDNFANPVTRSAPQWLAAYGITHVLYHNDIVGAEGVGEAELENLSAAGLTLDKRFDFVYLYHVAEPLGRIYTLPANGTFGKSTTGYPCVESFDDATGCFSASMANITWTYGVDIVPRNPGAPGRALRFHGLSEEEGDWLALTSNVFPVATDLVRMTLDLRQTSVLQTRVIVEGFDAARGKWGRISDAPAGVDGTFGWKHYETTLKVPETVHRLRLRLMAGWLEPGAREGEVLFDDLRVAELQATIPSMAAVASSGASVVVQDHPDATRWLLRGQASAPFRLVFTEAFDPYWLLTVSWGSATLHVRPMPFLDSIQIFDVNATGDLRIELTYTIQSSLDLGIGATLVSLAFLSGLVGLAAWERRRLREAGHPAGGSRPVRGGILPGGPRGGALGAPLAPGKPPAGGRTKGK